MLKRGFKTMLAEANAVIETISVQDLSYHLEDSETLLVDVRDLKERESSGEQKRPTRVVGDTAQSARRGSEDLQGR